MKQYLSPIHLKSLLALFLTCILAGCDRFCSGTSFSFPSNWVAENLDNSGIRPVLSNSPIAKAAYGIRVSNTPTVGALPTPECDDWSLTNPAQQIKIYTTRQFDDKIAGADITERFLGRLEPGENRGAKHTTYKPILEMLEKINYPSSRQLDPFYLDFVLIDEPSSPDTCQFRVEFVFADSSIVNMYTPKIFLQ